MAAASGGRQRERVRNQKGEETKAGWRDGGKQGWKDLWRRGEKEMHQEQDSSSFSVSLQATHNRRSEREGKRLVTAW